MNNIEHNEDDQKIYNKICNSAIITLATLAVPACFASVIRTMSIGWHSVMAIHIAVTIGLVVTAVFRHSISLQIRAGFIVFVLSIVGVTGLIKFGLISGAMITLITSPILATFFFGSRFGIIHLTSTIITLCFIAFGHVSGLFHNNYDISYVALLPTSWIAYILTALGCIATVIASTIMMRQHLMDALEASRNSARDLENKVTERTKELEEAKAAAESLARTDALTGLNNRRAFFEYAQVIDNQSRRYQHPYAVMMIDIDHFKSINDLWGHNIGDITIKTVGNIINENLRNTDIMGRIGGEEFSVILPETDIEGAMSVAERIRSTIEQTHIDNPKAEVKVTASFGLANFSGNKSTLEALMANADSALYQAKNSGRNKICRFS